MGPFRESACDTTRTDASSEFMKIKLLSGMLAVALVGLSSVAVSTAKAGETEHTSNPKTLRSAQTGGRLNGLKPKVVLIQVTGSRIPQRVLLFGQQVNSASPLFIVQGDDLVRAGAISVSGILSIDPSITFGAGGRGR